MSPLRYLALGDSYTIGEGVAPPERFPVQLAAMLRGEGLDVDEPRIIARTGWTTREMMAAVDGERITESFPLVTLLVGVNDQYRGGPVGTYKADFRRALELAVRFAQGTPRRAIVLSIPDRGVTPYARQDRRQPEKIAEEIDAFNAVNRAESSTAGVPYVDITPDSRAPTSLSDQRRLIASDGLHPSGPMYSIWARKALPAALAALRAE